MRFSGEPFLSRVEHLGRLEADERNHAAQIKVRLAVFGKRVKDPRREKPVVRMIGYHLHAHRRLNAVEAFRRESLEERVGRTVVAHAVDDVRAFRIFVHHLRHGVHVVLPVAVDRHGRVATELPRLHQAGPQGALVPPVAALTDSAEAIIAFCKV